MVVLVFCANMHEICPPYDRDDNPHEICLPYDRDDNPQTLHGPGIRVRYSQHRNCLETDLSNWKSICILAEIDWWICCIHLMILWIFICLNDTDLTKWNFISINLSLWDHTSQDLCTLPYTSKMPVWLRCYLSFLLLFIPELFPHKHVW